MNRLFVVWACALLVSGCTALGGGALKAQQLQKLQTELDVIAKAGESAARSGYVLKVRSGGEWVYRQQAGLASTAKEEAISEETVFELASLSKVFTAVAVMQLQEQGLIELDTPLAQYLPGLPQAWQELTVHHLLSHQSGLPDLINRWPRQRLDGFAFQDLMVYFSTHAELEFKPGSKGQYSNTNYVLLAELVSQVSGKDFGEYLRCHVFVPAGMVSSTVSVRSSQALSQALPYGNEVKPNDIDYVLLGAINQKSSVLDLEHFMDALLQNKLLQQATLDRMMKPHVQFDDGKRYGYGWYIGRLGGWAALSTELPAAGVGHSGRLGAYRSALYFNRERDFQLIMLSNGGIRTEKLLVDFLQKTREFLE